MSQISSILKFIDIKKHYFLELMYVNDLNKLIYNEHFTVFYVKSLFDSYDHIDRIQNPLIKISVCNTYMV
jgi:hypothetical protein